MPNCPEEKRDRFQLALVSVFSASNEDVSVLFFQALV